MLSPSKIKRVDTKHVRKCMQLMTRRGRSLTPERCYDAVVSDGTYTIVLVPREEGDVSCGHVHGLAISASFR